MQPSIISCETLLYSELPPRTLSEILAPSGLMVDHTFELNVDHWKFIGHPFSVQHGSFDVKFNIVFIVEVIKNLQRIVLHVVTLS